MILQQVAGKTKEFLEEQNGKNNGWDINSIFKKFDDEGSLIKLELHVYVL